jgi:hypothetical protein
MADQVVGLRIESDSTQAVQSIGNIKKELRAAQQEAVALSQKFGETSTEALDAAKRVAQLRDTVADTNERIALFDPGAKFQAFGNVLRTVAGGFSALTGAAALFGVESEQVEKTLLKVQSALALTEGLNTIADATKDFQRLSAVISQTSVFQKGLAASTALTSGAFKLFGVSVATTSTAFKALRTAIITTGIGALVIGITLLITKLASLKSNTESAADAQERLADSTRKANEAFNDQLDFVNRDIQLKIKRAKAAGATEAEITAIERNAIQERITLSSKEINRRVLDTKNQTEIGEITKQNLKDKQALEDFDLDQQIKRNEKARQDAAKAAQDGAADAAQRRAADKARREKQLEEDLEFAQRRARAFENPFADQSALEVLQAQRQAARERQIEFEKLAEEERRRNSADTDNLLIAGARRVAEVNAITRKQDLDNEKITQEQKAQIIAGALGSLADAVGRNSVAGKALAISQATIDGFLAVQKALASAPPPFNFIAAATVGVATLANIRRIAQTKIPGQASSGTVPAGAAFQAPSLPARAVTGETSLDQQSLNQIGNATARAFVVEADVTNNQERVTRLNRAARLG